jgi:hypothetical protein
MADHFYAEVLWKGESGILFLTSDGIWKVTSGADSFTGNAGTKGIFEIMERNSGTALFYGAKGQKDYAFSMTGVLFPPKITLEPKFLTHNAFTIGSAWSTNLGYENTVKAARANKAHWYPVATGALMNWIKTYCEERSQEAKQLAISLGLNVAAIFDPTGALSLAGAIEASTRGDYLACTLNLLGAIPLLGKAAQAVRNTQIAMRLESVLNELNVLREWLQKIQGRHDPNWPACRRSIGRNTC